MTQLESLDHLGDTYKHVYISPHLDDASLSCGGAIAAHLAAGERVLVVTICTAAPPANAVFSALAQQLHANWGLAADQAMATRLREERLAMERLGVDYFWVGRLDAIYRYPEAYNRRETLFGTPAPDDPLFADLRALFRELHQRLPSATCYAPLGIGSHVDHLIAHQAIRDTPGVTVRFYEDLPYAATTPGSLDQRLAQLAGVVSATTIPIDATLGQKLQAIHAYASQFKELFGDPTTMEQVMTDYAASVLPHDGRYAERIWRIDLE
jgi:LmbE family N-acetylglucosaminyl deacetylase